MSRDFPHNQLHCPAKASFRTCTAKPHYKFHVHFVTGHCIPFLMLQHSFPEIMNPFSPKSHAPFRKSGLTNSRMKIHASNYISIYISISFKCTGRSILNWFLRNYTPNARHSFHPDDIFQGRIVALPSEK